MKKIISLFLLVALVSLALCLAACKDDAADLPSGTESGDVAVESGAESESDEAEQVTYPAPVLPDEDYTNQTFNVLVRHNGTEGYDIYADVDSGDTLKEAVYKRNMIIEEKYGIKITELGADDASISDLLYNSVAGNEKLFDMVDMSFQQSFTAALQGILLDLSTDLEHLDLSNPWWDHSANEDFTLLNHQYFAIGNANLDAIRGTWALIYNKNIMDDLGYEEDYIYDLVRSGEWTHDSYAKIIKGFAKDLNNDNMMTEVDQYALAGNGSSLLGFMMNSGIRIIEKDENDELYFSDFSDRTNEILMSLSDILSTRNTFNVDNLNQNTTGDGKIWTNTFLEGRSLFFSESLRTIENFRDMTADFGIVPHPKYSVDDEYGTFIHWYIGQAFGVPITAADLTKTAIMMEEMSYLATDEVLPVYYTRVIEGKYARDESSYEMITEYIMPNRIYDVGMTNTTGNFMFSLYSHFLNGTNAFASTYRGNTRVMEQAVEELNETFR